MNKEPKKYFGIALDPIHIGAGGYRVGSVDNTIVREPTTNVPKIPGTSLAGVIRAYAEIAKKENDTLESIRIEDVFGTEEKQGMVGFYDGQIIFFPITSIQGTVWVTTKELFEYWLKIEGISIPEGIEDKAYAIKGINTTPSIDLGWLLLEVVNIPKNITLGSKLDNFIKRIVITSDKLFSHIVNDNLEVRTSVRIDPETGTAKKGALFTYEAISRGTVFGFEIVIDPCKGDTSIINLINATFPYLKLLGLGGLGTRGFGRVEIFSGQSKSGGGQE